MCLAQGPRRSDACEARTCGLSVSSQAFYDRATALPIWALWASQIKLHVIKQIVT